MDQAYLDLKAWLEQTRDEPLEGMEIGRAHV